MGITQHDIDQAHSDLKDIHGGVREDYFGLLYLEREFGLKREQAVRQVAFGGNDYGIDAFHIDPARRNFYLFQFKWATSYTHFKASFQRLIDDGIERVFGNPTQDQKMNSLLIQLKSRLLNDQALIDRVFIHFVFNGDPEDAERSTVLDALRENLEGKKYLIDQFFGRQISLVIEFRSARTTQVGGITHQKKTYTYDLEIEDVIERGGPNGEQMQVGFVRLVNLHKMYQDMKQRFFERNIRAGLSEEEAPNRAIKRSLKGIILDGAESPSVFAFNHNGVTIFAEKFEKKNEVFQVTEPRMLNGAQTVTTFDTFLQLNKENQRLHERKNELRDLWVLCKIITNAAPPFVVTVTINNNRQNPVKPWNLRANDLIQLEFQDKFRDDLSIYYERQEKMFESLTDEDLEELEITQWKAIELLRLTKTFLASDGLIDRMSNMRLVFENDNTYDQVFNETRLKADSRKIFLCYKVEKRLRKMMEAIMEKGATKYAFLTRARNLLWAILCQAILNDEELEFYCDQYGQSLVIEADYTNWITQLASSRARILIGSLIKEEPYATHARNDNYSFLRTQAFFKKCMDLAYDKWGWVQKKLK